VTLFAVYRTTNRRVTGRAAAIIWSVLAISWIAVFALAAARPYGGCFD
jgi:hypothetical protein